ncbi:LysR family transcriptional regulator [Roseivirga sp. E12]|uniref:LysR family transcriptional regulator n=1 Tax=Roseivirga sp. E12 TaxID=2819237 RepID=UPI001ABC06D1|nr:LysR family transcriptional regulator [Roseivirga sp. E12]MBO3697689.1 LysR family transcriptional regulator [Roseivirga sp. E12]
MELKYFRLIKTIAEEGNIANSSEKLFLTQSALSHQLRELEERLGFKVFHRTRNNWKLTKEGKELHKLANELFEKIDLGFSNIQQIKEGSKGSIRLSAECQSFFHGLPAFVQKMAVLYPEIEIDLSLDGSQRTVSQVLSDEVDIAIVTSEPATDSLFKMKVLEDEIFTIMHREHRFGDLPYLDVSHFADLHLIINSFPLESVSVYEHFLKPNKIIPQKVTAIPFTEVSLEMVNANMGVVCLPKWSLKSYKLPEDLVFKKIGRNGLKRSHYLVVKEEQRNRKHINAFIENFQEEFVR